MTNLVVETQDCRVGHDWRFGKIFRAEAEGSGNLGEILKEDTFLDVNKGACAEASRELWSVLARYTSSGASATVKSVTDSKVWRLGRNSMQTTVGKRWGNIQSAT